MRLRAGILAAALSVALGGCGTSPAEQVRAKVQQFVHAVETRDYRTLCERVLAPALVVHLAEAGVPCEQAMQAGLASLKDPTLSIGRVAVSGNSAKVVTLSGAVGQSASLSALELTRTAAGWRVSALGSPLS